MYQASSFGLKAAASVAAQIDIMLIAKGKLNLDSKQNMSGKNVTDQLTSEFEINDAPLSARNVLTKGHTQDEISQFSGCAVSTRGRYMTLADKAKNPTERPLYLFIQGPNKQSLDLAIQKIYEIIRMEQLPASTKFRNGPPNFSNPLVTSVEKIYIGIENVAPSFDLRGKIIGTRGANLNYIRSETGAIVTLRGKGSLFIDPNLGSESSEPLHLYIEHPKYEGLAAAKQLALNLIETLQQEVAQCQPQVIIQPQGQQMTMFPQPVPPPMTLVPPPNSGVMTFKQAPPNTQLIPPQLNVPPPSVHIPPQQGPMIGQQPPLTGQPPPQLNVPPVMNVQLSSHNLTGNPNNMIITSSGQLLPSQTNQTHQMVFVSQPNLMQNIQASIAGHLNFTQPPIQVQSKQNVQTTTVSVGLQGQSHIEHQPHMSHNTTAPTHELIHPSNNQLPNPQFQCPPPHPPPNQNIQQILSFGNPNFPQQFVPAPQLQGPPQVQAQIPQVQMIQPGQPLHILSSQGLSLQNPQFIQQQIPVNQLQGGTLQQLNALQVPPGTSPGQVTFQVPIQNQPGAHNIVQQPNLQGLNSGQTSIVLTQQNVQSPQQLQTITQGANFFQQPTFQPIVQSVPTSQAQFLNQGQMGVYTSQGLVLVQSNQNLQPPPVQQLQNLNQQALANQAEILQSQQIIQQQNQQIQQIAVSQTAIPGQVPNNIQHNIAAAEQQKTELEEIQKLQEQSTANNIKNSGNNNPGQVNTSQASQLRQNVPQGNENISRSSPALQTQNQTPVNIIHHQLQPVQQSQEMQSAEIPPMSIQTIPPNIQMQINTQQQQQQQANFQLQQNLQMQQNLQLQQNIQDQRNAQQNLVQQNLMQQQNLIQQNNIELKHLQQNAQMHQFGQNAMINLQNNPGQNFLNQGNVQASMINLLQPPPPPPTSITPQQDQRQHQQMTIQQDSRQATVTPGQMQQIHDSRQIMQQTVMQPQPGMQPQDPKQPMLTGQMPAQDPKQHAIGQIQHQEQQRQLLFGHAQAQHPRQTIMGQMQPSQESQISQDNRTQQMFQTAQSQQQMNTELKKRKISETDENPSSDGVSETKKVGIGIDQSQNFENAATQAASMNQQQQQNLQQQQQQQQQQQVQVVVGGPQQGNQESNQNKAQKTENQEQPWYPPGNSFWNNQGQGQFNAQRNADESKTESADKQRSDASTDPKGKPWTPKPNSTEDNSNENSTENSPNKKQWKPGSEGETGTQKQLKPGNFVEPNVQIKQNPVPYRNINQRREGPGFYDQAEDRFNSFRNNYPNQRNPVFRDRPPYNQYPGNMPYYMQYQGQNWYGPGGGYQGNGGYQGGMM